MNDNTDERKPFQELQLKDLIDSYRHVKVDTFFDKGIINALDFADYEDSFIENISNLLSKIQSGNEGWIDDIFLGEYTFQLKDITSEPVTENHVKLKKIHDPIIYSSKNKTKVLPEEKVLNPVFRLLGIYSIEFHILSALWIEKVGRRLEKHVKPCSYGCRLKKQSSFDLQTFGDKYNSSGQFRPYFKDYKTWQGKGINTIKKGIEDKKSIISITTDVTKFYHRICAEFLLEEDFLTNLGAKPYSQAEKEITELLVCAYKKWSDSAPKHFERSCKGEASQSADHDHCGIPIGLSASKVIANLLLAPLDREILQGLNPLYYGRYVDDIFIVIEDHENIGSRDDFWKLLDLRIEGIKSEKGLASTYETKYASRCKIEFGISKERIFFLDGTIGKAFIDNLSSELAEISSEWRLLPDFDHDIDKFVKDVIQIDSLDGEEATSLRKVDKLSVQRAKFAITLRKLSTQIKFLPKTIWINQLEEFTDTILNFVLSPINLHTYYRYYPSIIGLAIEANEPNIACRLWNNVVTTWKDLKTRIHSKNDFDSTSEQITLAMNQNLKSMKEAIYSYSSIDISTLFADKAMYWNRLYSLIDCDSEKALKFSSKLFNSDLHNIAYKQRYLNKKYLNTFEENCHNKHRFLNEISSKYSECGIITEFLKANFSKSSEGITKGLFLYTRKLSILELTTINKKWYIDPIKFNKVLSAFHRSSIEIEPTGSENKQPPSNMVTLNFCKSNEECSNPMLALTSFETKDSSWVSHVRDDIEEPDETRYKRLFKLINDIISCNEQQVDYVILPELAVSIPILHYIGKMLGRIGISLISGVEYEKTAIDSPFPGHATAHVSNRMAYILTIQNHKFSSQVLIMQEKEFPAPQEAVDLLHKGGKVLKSTCSDKFIITHKGWTFSGLICNELLNIDYRSTLRGKIDALLVLEWNRDIDSFDALVQATSLELHTFVIQVNNRLYGDTRIRGPYKEPYKRDLVRIRGGESDYFVHKRIDVKTLREFQRDFTSSDNIFKPVPTAFQMCPKRRR